MTIFTDASALIAMIARERDASALLDRLEQDRERVCSPLAAWEAGAGLCRSHGLSVEAARSIVAAFLDASGIRMVAIGAPEYAVAVDAYAKFGRGRHPAALNMGDCFAYACATTHRASLLYKGEDFAQTDLA